MGKEQETYYKNWDSELFIKQLTKLGDLEGSIVLNVLRLMEHGVSLKEVKIKYGIKIARIEKGWTEAELIKEVGKKVGGTVDDSVRSMLKSNYTTSSYLPIVLDILEIDEDFLIQCSERFNISTKGKEKAEIEETTKEYLHWLFDTLSVNDKNAISYLVHALLNEENIEQFLQNFKEMQQLNKKRRPEDFMPNLGVTTDVNIPD